MALGLNHVLLIGTLVRPPDLRYTPGGTAVLRLDVAGDEHTIDETNSERVRPWYQRVTVLGGQAERMGDDLHVGAALWLEGRLEHRKWRDDDGSNRSSLDVIAQRAERLHYGARDPEEAVTFDARDQPRLRDAVNVVRLIGNLTRDAEVSQPEGGTPLARFAVAVQGRREDATKEAHARDEVAPHYVEVRAWRHLAERCRTLAKGQPVYLEGRLATDAWTDGEGAKRWATRVELTRVEWLERPAKPDERFLTGTAATPEQDDGAPLARSA